MSASYLLIGRVPVDDRIIEGSYWPFSGYLGRTLLEVCTPSAFSFNVALGLLKEFCARHFYSIYPS